MSYIISTAYLAVLISAVFVILRWSNVRCCGQTPVGTFTFVALLFTAGLDMGLVMLPLTEFPVYAADEAYRFTNPLAIEFGMWGPLVWMMYFLSAFYFVVLEPRLQIFEIAIVKWVYNLTVIATCAFTCYLFLTALPSYIGDVSATALWAIVLCVIAVSVYSSGSVNFMKWLAVSSTWMFVTLAVVAVPAAAYYSGGAGAGSLASNLGLLSDYFANLHRFVSPITAYHEFYLFWWFSWSIMIGQFVSMFVGGLRTWRLAGAMILLPSIPLAVWFAVLYIYFERQITIPGWLNWFMVTVGIVFVVNSLDSLIRLYGLNLGWTKTRLGPAYYPLHFFLQLGLVMAYQFTPFKIEWVGVVVIGIYAAVYALMLRRRTLVRAAVTEARGTAGNALPAASPS
ncbi:choline transporter [Sinorhizobium alkalisoli]|uniref:Choline transporter n=1 Tax=Sinorhizobium alkalisoli TaxID=1752398 RepID=A0A1E3VFY5_9HYPH|nr:choline transporter [Sinorhizobium alkalisoli]MCA1491796.1 BCCT family transporter [Ensifer sp. NBAIM29]ODR92465.1 choline transporter [Sinorhizobium alkalisoli]